MIKFHFSIDFEKPKWWWRIFPCKHEVASVEENIFSRYGCHTSYLMCLKCGRTAMDIERNCKHVIDSFGRCIYCKSRLEKHDCKHEHWCREPDTDDYFCDTCGEWKDEI